MWSFLVLALLVLALLVLALLVLDSWPSLGRLFVESLKSLRLGACGSGGRRRLVQGLDHSI